MKNRALAWLLVVVLAVGFLVLPVTPSYAWSHGYGRVFIGVGVGPGFWWGPPYPYYWYPPPYYPPVIVQSQPQVYVQQAPAPPSAPPGDWYYCQSAGGYYPPVQNCPEPWMRVPPRNQ